MEPCRQLHEPPQPPRLHQDVCRWRGRCSLRPSFGKLEPVAGQGRAGRVHQFENGDQQLRVSPAGEIFAFQNFLRIADEWRSATLPGISLVTGPSFPLHALSVSKSGSVLNCGGSASAEDLQGKAFPYSWEGNISAQDLGADCRWFRFSTKLSLSRDIKLHQASQVEPQIVVWLSTNSTLMEGQSGSWRRVLLQQPTRNSLGAWGNDLPAVYLLDQNVGVETMMFFDVGEMSWMSAIMCHAFWCIDAPAFRELRGTVHSALESA